MVLEWQMCQVGWTLLILTAQLFTGRVFLHLRRNPARVFLGASARPYLHNTATRFPSKGLRVAVEGSSMEPWERTVDQSVVALTQQRTNNV